MADLDTLRSEVQEAMHRLENYLHITIDGKHFRSEDYDTIRAELLRLANENADYGKHAIEQYKRGVYWMDRAKEAEAELAAIKDENAQLRDVLADRGMDREMAAHTNKELEALKARMEGGIDMGCPVECFVGSRRGRILNPFTPPAWIGKRVRLIVEE